MTYLVIAMWIFLGLTAVLYDRKFDQLAVYFLSLSGFAAAYVFGELKRPSKSTALFMKGPSSSREAMMYWIITIWFFLGIIGITQDLNFTQLGAYFSSLTPFVAAFIIGDTFKPEIPVSVPVEETPAEETTDEEAPVDVPVETPEEETKPE